MPSNVLPGFTPWPEADAHRYREQKLWAGETFGDVLSARAAATPDALAVVDDTHRWTYGELDRRSRGLATGLARLGIGRQDRVLVQLPNRAEFVEVIFALFRLGALPVFCLPAHRAAELTPIATAAAAKAVITCGQHQRFDHAALADSIRAEVDSVEHVLIVGEDDAVLPEHARALAEFRDEPGELPAPDPSDVAFLQLSGGSTGIPKLIPRTHDDYLYSVRRSAEICELDSDTVYLATLPVAHNFPMSSPGILGALWAGGTVAMTPDPTPATAFAAIERFGVTITGLVPPLARLWVERAEAGATPDLSSLRVVQVGGARCQEELARRIGPALGVTLQQVFGMAEGLVCYTRLDDPLDVVIATQGRPMSEHDRIAVVDDDGTPVPPGADGNLITQGPYTIRGYYDNPDADARSFTTDGWYRTGDVVSVRPDGNLVVKGRAGDWVNRGGEKVSAEELEAHLLEHPAVRDAVIIGTPDPVLGQRICAFVQPVDDAERPTLTAVRTFVRERGVAAWKMPDAVVIVEQFPETGVGKTSRRELRRLLAAGAPTA
ncbi:(2,3-dihydroxybenzoyl)adenylate synthase [Nocardia cyriacigeorgica]|uniref:(2,3-dihydroxybenzoyl)adenylate synthase n=1 Tax=Nocardia cyriacigeorgica TaxID=135487 RepID=UPI001895009B|nr:AMP-binding protein [Nocardia cyriacigeorgica]MBF6322403.1 AMP-binding protein [Nocardia cyriacigeorgica]MBF6498613.1 AMP-binding protein [Nocardia cyriacigeorgica]